MSEYSSNIARMIFLPSFDLSHNQSNMSICLINHRYCLRKVTFMLIPIGHYNVMSINQVILTNAYHYAMWHHLDISHFSNNKKLQKYFLLFPIDLAKRSHKCVSCYDLQTLHVKNNRFCCVMLLGCFSMHKALLKCFINFAGYLCDISVSQCDVLV